MDGSEKRLTAVELETTNGKFVRVAEWLCVRNGRLYGIKKVRGKVVRQVAPVQGLAAMDGRGRVTAAAKKWVKRWGEGLENEPFFAAERRAVVPTLGALLEAYEGFAAVEWELNHSPGPETLRVVRNSYKQVVRECGLGMEDLISTLTRERMDGFVAEGLARGMRPLSIFAHLSHVRSVFARWVMERYQAKGWEVACPDFPRRRGRFMERTYYRPPVELRERTMAWYWRLEEKEPMVWTAASLMLQFGMRNGDAGRLRWEDIVREGERWVLGYQPGKTSTSSGRRVHCVMSDAFYAQLRAAGGKGRLVVEDAKGVFARLNGMMRELGWRPPEYFKGAYELRKMCIDRVYREFGAEAAVQVSGDDIKTVCRFYADPSRAKMMPVNMARPE